MPCTSERPACTLPTVAKVKTCRLVFTMCTLPVEQGQGHAQAPSCVVTAFVTEVVHLLLLERFSRLLRYADCQ